MAEEIAPRVEPLEHTADAGIIVHARTLPELFELAARGMYALIVDPDTVHERGTWPVAARGHDLPALLAAWLAELLFLTDARGVAFRSFLVDSIEGGAIQARVRGERLDPKRHAMRVGVKAVTHHGLDVSEVPGGYRARILFDI